MEVLVCGREKCGNERQEWNKYCGRSCSNAAVVRRVRKCLLDNVSICSNRKCDCQGRKPLPLPHVPGQRRLRRRRSRSNQTQDGVDFRGVLDENRPKCSVCLEHPVSDRSLQCSPSCVTLDAHARREGYASYQDRLERWLAGELNATGCNGRDRAGLIGWTRRWLLEAANYECTADDCGWIKRPYTALEVDHADGNRNNNYIWNVRVLCAGCHAETPTYRGRNRNAYSK